VANGHLKMEFLQTGAGPALEAGQIASVHYTGWLENGTKFDSSVDRNEPFEVAAGVGQVISGWDIALLRMRVGDKARLTIPAHLGYGEHGVQTIIPPNSTLIFEVELLEAK
jgi:FKBP-type peptidyl-prolyl cis-trans isomerase